MQVYFKITVLSLQREVPQPVGAGPSARRVLGAAVRRGIPALFTAAVGVSSGEGESRGANAETGVEIGGSIRDSEQDQALC